MRAWMLGAVLFGILMMNRAKAFQMLPDTRPPAGDREAFIAWAGPRAQAMQRRLGIPASVCVAQAIYESGSGGSFLAQNAKNLFGVMAVGTGQGNPFWHGNKVFRGDREWRVYDSYADSLMDYGHLFYRVGAYAPGLYFRSNPVEFLRAIVPVYAPASDGNNRYFENVAALISQHNLTRFDLRPDQLALDPELVPPAHRVVVA